MAAPIQFCKSADGTRLAFIDLGRRDGRPLVFVQGVGGSFEAPLFSGILGALASRRRVIVFDRRGTGASAREVERIGLDAEVEDIAAVAGHLQLSEFDLWGNSETAGVAVAYAVAYPGRVSHLIFFGGFASGPSIDRTGAVDAFNALVRSNWRMARNSIADMVYPSGPAEEKVQLASALKETLEPDMAARIFDFFWHMDVTEKLGRVTCPTLVLHRRGDSLIPVSAARELASQIPDAQLVVLDGDVNICHYNFDQYIDTVWDFLGEPPPTAADGTIGVGKLVELMEEDQEIWKESDYVPPPKDEASKNALRTVLFTDLVGHTEMMQRLGDEAGRAVLREHERITREVLKQHGGTEVKTMGDGFMASFGSVTRAVECAIALQRAFAERGSVGAPLGDGGDAGGAAPDHAITHPTFVEPLHIRVGLNAGEPIEEDGDLFGATVILASRIAAKAEGGEILVADTVRGLCSGKGFLFADRGEFIAKGFEDPVRIYEVNWRT